MQTWQQLEAMLKNATSAEFRNKMPDSFGNGWIYTWYYLDHVGFVSNPRNRDLGFHRVYDRYKQILNGNNDGEGWHFHPVSISREAHRCATSYLRGGEFFEILSRKILERNWFPSLYRAGFQAERPDSHWLLEQWIPFDLSNMSVSNAGMNVLNDRDFKNGRSADWRRAPSDWSPYHPAHDDYQAVGHCRRWIGRALNILTRNSNLDLFQVEQAFDRASGGKPTLMATASHDFRDLAVEVDFIRDLVSQVKERYPSVKIKYCSALEAFRSVIWPEGISDASLDLKVEFIPASEEDVPMIRVITEAGKVFGPQPFLAIKARDGRFIHDNFDFSLDLKEWSYPFHADTIEFCDVAEIGVAASDQYGNVCIRRVDF